MKLLLKGNTVEITKTDEDDFADIFTIMMCIRDGAPMDMKFITVADDREPIPFYEAMT